MSDSSHGAAGTVHCLAQVSEIFSDLASWLRQIEEVTRVMQACSMTTLSRREDGVIEYGTGDGVGVDWYADGEFSNGRALSFGLELSWDGNEWLVEPGIRLTHRGGQDDLIDLADRYAVDDADMCDSLLGAARELAGLWDEALEVFRSWPG